MAIDMREQSGEFVAAPEPHGVCRGAAGVKAAVDPKQDIPAQQRIAAYTECFARQSLDQITAHGMAREFTPDHHAKPRGTAGVT